LKEALLQELGQEKLIVGLGNPGKEYDLTRHNIGFLVVRQLAEDLKAKFSLSSLTNGLTAKAKTDYGVVHFLMPLTYMNNSGVAVKEMVAKNAFSYEKIFVIIDDLNLPFGQVRIRAKGSHGGHNGLVSIIKHLAGNEFPRLRMGIGHPKSKSDIINYVLEEFNKNEKESLKEFIMEGCQCCMTWIKDGITKAMDQHNRRS